MVAETLHTGHNYMGHNYNAGRYPAHGCRVYGHACADVRMVMCADVCTGMCVDMCAVVCMVCMGMYVDMCVDMCVDVCMGMYRPFKPRTETLLRASTCVETGTRRHVRGNLCRHVCRHECRHAQALRAPGKCPPPGVIARACVRLIRRCCTNFF